MSRKILSVTKKSLLSIVALYLIFHFSIVVITSSLSQNQFPKSSYQSSFRLHKEPKYYSATDIFWSNATRLSEKDGYGSFSPEIASDGLGNVYVVWYDESAKYYEIFYRAYFKHNNSWSSIQIICEKDTFSSNPRITTDEDNYVHVSWWDSTGTGESLFYRFFDGKSWSDIIEVVNCDEVWSNHEIISANNGSIYFFWIERMENYSQLFFRSYSLLTKTFTQKNPITDSSSWANSPSAVVDSLNNIHLVWEAKDEDMLAYEIHYKHLAGTDWQIIQPIVISKIDNTSDDNPEIIIDSKNNLHVTWEHSGEIHYQLKTGNVWSQEIKISNHGWAVAVDITVDKNDNLHLTWEENTWLMYKQFNLENGWSYSVNLTDFFSIMFFPKITADIYGNVHIVWNDYSIDSMWEIFYIFGNIYNLFDNQTILFLISIYSPVLIGNIIVIIIISIRYRKS